MGGRWDDRHNPGALDRSWIVVVLLFAALVVTAVMIVAARDGEPRDCLGGDARDEIADGNETPRCAP